VNKFSTTYNLFWLYHICVCINVWDYNFIALIVLFRDYLIIIRISRILKILRVLQIGQKSSWCSRIASVWLDIQTLFFNYTKCSCTSDYPSLIATRLHLELFRQYELILFGLFSVHFHMINERRDYFYNCLFLNLSSIFLLRIDIRQFTRITG